MKRERVAETGWRNEFDESFDVPSVIEDISIIDCCTDLSWHNDVSPSFGWQNSDGDNWLRVWVNHPDRDLREFDCPRYQVVRCFHDVNGVEDVTLHYEGDDADAAVQCFREALAQMIGAQS